MAIKIEMLRYFAAVARSGNLADAAAALGRTPSAVSMVLKQFESHLGSPLFESERKNRLTTLGAFTLSEATRELDHFERTVAAIENFASAKSGFVRIAAVPSIAEAILPTVTRIFLRDRPGVRIDIRDMDSAAVLRELERERVDLGLATGTGAGSDVRREELFSDTFGVVCRADHALVEQDLPLTWDDIGAWPFIANGLCAQIADPVFQRIFTSSQLMVRNTTSLLALVRADMGTTVLPRLVVQCADRELAFLPIADENARRRLDILCRAHAELSPSAQSFVETVRKVASELIRDF